MWDGVNPSSQTKPSIFFYRRVIGKDRPKNFPGQNCSKLPSATCLEFKRKKILIYG